MVMHGSVIQWDSDQQQASVWRKLMLMMQLMITEMVDLRYLWSILMVEKVKEEQEDAQCCQSFHTRSYNTNGPELPAV